MAAEDLVEADGRCAPPADTPQAGNQPAPASADRPVGSVAGDLASAPMPAAPVAAEAGAPPLIGGIALGMSECEVVRRGGTPSNVSISLGDKNERKAVLTYLSGTWPGIYTFASGRLKEISRAPEQPKPAKATPKKRTKQVIKKKPSPTPVLQVR